MPAPRSLMLMQCVSSPGNADDGKWWLAECYHTSDGPRMRVIPCRGMDEEEARDELARRQALVAQPEVVTVEACRKANLDAYNKGKADGRADGLSRARNTPGNGDIGG